MVVASCKSKKNTVSTTTAPAPVQERTVEKKGQRPHGQRGQRGDRTEPPSVEQVFKMDVNNDGKLSKSEVKGRLLERFTDIDTDKDGFISKTEFSNAPKPKRRPRPDN